MKYTEGQIVEVRLSEGDADNLNKGNLFFCFPIQIVGYEKPFDWSTVKPGMAFREREFGLVWYLAEHPNSVYVIVAKINQSDTIEDLANSQIISKVSLTRDCKFDLTK